jgi:hypothetical protein
MAIKKTVEIDILYSDVGKLEDALKAAGVQFERIENKAKDVKDEVKKTTDSGTRDLSLLDDVTGGAASKFEDAKRGVEGMNLGLKGTKSALLASGIGALVVILGAIIANWEDIVAFIDIAGRRIQENIDLSIQRKEQLDDEIDILDKQMELNELEGRSNVEILKLKQKKLEFLQAENDFLITNLELQLENEKSKAREVTWWETIKIAAGGLLGTSAQAEIIAESINTNTEEAVKIQNQLNDAKKNQIQIEIDIFNAKKGLKPGETRDEATGLQVEGEDVILPISGIDPTSLQTNIDLEATMLADAETGLTALQQQEANRRKAIKQAEINEKRALQQAEIQLLFQFGGVLRQLGENNKTLAIAGIVAEQIASASAVIQATNIANAKAVAANPLSAGQPWVTINTISAGLSIASGVLAASKAISQLGGSAGGLDTQAASALPNPATAQSAPSFNIVGASPINQLQDSILNAEQNPIQAFVVEKEMTSAQELERNKIDVASI